MIPTPEQVAAFCRECAGDCDFVNDSVKCSKLREAQDAKIDKN